MRILIATWHQQLISGMEGYLREIIPALQGRGHEIRLLVENRAAPGRLTIDPPNTTPPWVACRQNAGEVFRDVAGWPAQVCFLHGMADARLQEQLIDALPTVFFAHNYHGTCISGSKRYGFPFEQPCNRTFGAGCLLFYYARRCGGLSPLRMVKDYRIQAERNRLLLRYRGIVVASRHVEREYLRHGIPADRVHLLPLFPTGQVGDSIQSVSRPMTGRLLFAGRLTDVKGGHHAIRATRIAADRMGRPLSLVVLGDGPDRLRLEALARKERVDAAFPGWMSADRRDELMRGADLLLVPSSWPEPFGLVGVEAGRFGVPAVGFAVGGIVDWLIPGVSGELAPGNPCRYTELAEAICRALANPDHWAALCRGARETSQRFNLPAHLDRLEAVLAKAATR